MPLPTIEAVELVDEPTTLSDIHQVAILMGGYLGVDDPKCTFPFPAAPAPGPAPAPAPAPASLSFTSTHND